MRDYEIISILRGTETSAVEQGKSALKTILERNKAKVVKEDDWGMRKFPHSMDKVDVGHYVLTTLQVDPANVSALRHELDIEQSILRYIVKRTA